jgi:hypothetical protein
MGGQGEKMSVYALRQYRKGRQIYGLLYWSGRVSGRIKKTLAHNFPVKPERCRRPGSNTQFFQNMADVVANRLVANAQRLANLPVGLAPGQQRQHLSFPRRQALPAMADFRLSTTS